MRAVVQRVLRASVEVDGEVVSEIGPGLLALVGIRDTDTDKDLDYICRKVLGVRLWPDEEKGKAWDKSVTAMGYEVLFVSQFTLFGYPSGNKPDFHLAMKPGPAREMYDKLLGKARGEYVETKVKDGVFGAMMQVSLTNDGPVTLQLDSQHPKPA